MDLDKDSRNTVLYIIRLIGWLLIILFLIVFTTFFISRSHINQQWFEIFGAVSSGIASIGSILLLMVTFMYFLQTRELVIETKRQRELMEDPAVSLKIVPEDNSPNILNLVIKNTGGGPAYDVSVTFNPDIPYKDTSLNNLKMFQRMPLLDKGEEVKFFFDMAYLYFESEHPKETLATVKYFRKPNTEGRRNNPPIERKIFIDIQERIDQLHIERRDMHDLVNEIEELKHAVIMSIYRGDK